MIKSLKTKLVKDSRGNYTVEAIVNGHSAMCPSGKSKGKHEAKTVDAKRAVENINKIIAKQIVGKDFTQEELDNLLIKLAGKNKAKLGANATTAASMAFCRASASDMGKKLYKYISEIFGNEKFLIPIPMMNIINGGVHAKNGLSIQEFMIIPVKADSFKDAFEICTNIYAKLRMLVKEFYGVVNIGDEGGFSPPIEKTEHALNLLQEAVKRTGYEDKVKFGLDAAASQFFRNRKYNIDGKKLTSKELQNYYLELIEKYPIISIEDPFRESDWNGFA
jgi:enolase